MNNNFDELLEKAISGDDEAQHSIGSKYRYGLDVEQNIPETVNWFEKAIEQGNMEARKDLYNMSRFIMGTSHLNSATNDFLLPRIESILDKYPDDSVEQECKVESGLTPLERDPA